MLVDGSCSNQVPRYMDFRACPSTDMMAGASKFPIATRQRAWRQVGEVPLTTEWRLSAAQQTFRYSITSSARARSVGGTVIPSDLAVFSLMIS